MYVEAAAFFFTIFYYFIRELHTTYGIVRACQELWYMHSTKRQWYVKKKTQHTPQTGEYLESWYVSRRMNVSA